MMITEELYRNCNWISRGLKHANLYRVDDGTLNNRIAVVKS